MHVAAPALVVGNLLLQRLRLTGLSLKDVGTKEAALLPGHCLSELLTTMAHIFVVILRVRAIRSRDPRVVSKGGTTSGQKTHSSAARTQK